MDLRYKVIYTYAVVVGLGFLQVFGVDVVSEAYLLAFLLVLYGIGCWLLLTIWARPTRRSDQNGARVILDKIAIKKKVILSAGLLCTWVCGIVFAGLALRINYALYVLLVLGAVIGWAGIQIWFPPNFRNR